MKGSRVTEPVFVVHENPTGWDPPHYVARIDLGYAGLPGQIEQVWLKDLNDGLFRLDCIPFCAYGLAYRDLVTLDPDGVHVTGLRERSGHCVLRALIGAGEEHVVAEVRRSLDSAADRFDAAREVHGGRLLAFDIRPDADPAPLLAALHAGRAAGHLHWEWGDASPFRVSRNEWSF
jgi:Domain of unknown function (DUF4265)